MDPKNNLLWAACSTVALVAVKYYADGIEFTVGETSILFFALFAFFTVWDGVVFLIKKASQKD
jgi:hypothetical protein